MRVVKPATIAKRVGDQINESMLDMTGFFEPHAFRILRWRDELQKLMKADAKEAHRWDAMLHHMTGNATEMERSINNAIALGLPASLAATDFLTGFANLTMAGKALPHYQKSVDIKYGNLLDSVYVGVAVGLFQRADVLFEQALLAKLEMPKEFDVDVVKTAAHLLRSQGVTDELCAQVVDAAGEVLRGRGLFWLDQSPKLMVNDLTKTVGIQYRVAADYADAALMTIETAEKLIDRDLDTLPFYVTFIGAEA